MEFVGSLFVKVIPWIIPITLVASWVYTHKPSGGSGGKSKGAEKKSAPTEALSDKDMTQ